jgi:hypothetical protein
MERKEEIKKMERILENLAEDLLEIDVKVGVLLKAKNGIVDEMTPLVAAVQKIDYKLKLHSERKLLLIMEYGKGSEVLSQLEGEVAQEAYIR